MRISIPLIFLISIVFAHYSRGDVFDILLDNADFPEELQKKLINKTDQEKKKILKDHYTQISKGIAVAAHGGYPTKAAHRIGEEFNPETKALHEEIIAEFLGKDCEKTPDPGQKPKLILTAGAPGAGKSTVIDVLAQQGLFNKNDYVYIDVDEIRKKLPEYKNLTELFTRKNLPDLLEKVSQFTQLESSLISEEIHKRALALGKNIVRDGTLRNAPFFAKIISDANEHGYESGILHVDVPVDIARARVESRAKETGRRIDENFLISANPEVINSSAEKLKKMSSFYIKINNEDVPAIEACVADPLCATTNAKNFSSEYEDLKSSPELINQFLEKLVCQANTTTHAQSRTPIIDLENAPPQLKKCVALLHASRKSCP